MICDYTIGTLLAYWGIFSALFFIYVFIRMGKQLLEIRRETKKMKDIMKGLQKKAR